MKKVILTILIGGLMMTGAFAKTAFVYFSATGTTERMAKNAAKEMGADIFEIQPVHKYTDADLNWHDKKSLSTIECNDPKSRPAIKAVVSTGTGSAFDISDYDTVVLCYPIWWAYAPKILYTFVESQNWAGKKMITLCTSGGSGLGFARIAHLLASHWYYLFMSLHIGLHAGMIANKIESSQQDNSAADHSKPGKVIFRIFVALACAYGIYAFITRGVWKYLILQQQFFFFDLEKGYILFALDYLSIIILFATLSHLIATSLKKP